MNDDPYPRDRNYDSESAVFNWKRYPSMGNVPVVWIVGVALIVIAVLYLFDGRSGFDEHWQTAEELSRDGEWSAANEAYALAVEALEKDQAHPPHDQVAEAYIFASVHYVDVGRLKKANAVANAAVAIVEERKSNSKSASSRDKMLLGFAHVAAGRVLVLLADYAEAERAFDRASATFSPVRLISADAYDEGMSVLLVDKAWLAFKTADYRRMSRYCAQAQKIAKTSLGENDIRYAIALECAAIAAEMTDEFEWSEHLYRLAASRAVAIEGTDSEVHGWILSSYATYLRDQGRLEESEDAFARADDILTEAGLALSPGFARHTMHFGRLHVVQGRHAKAQIVLEKAQTRTAEIFGSDHINVAEVLNHLAEAYDGLGQTEDAAAARARAEEIKANWKGG